MGNLKNGFDVGYGCMGVNVLCSWVEVIAVQVHADFIEFSVDRGMWNPRIADADFEPNRFNAIVRSQQLRVQRGHVDVMPRQ
ncbi:MAG: hypothetical protein ACO25T_10300, partial [Arenimonas sp.]